MCMTTNLLQTAPCSKTFLHEQACPPAREANRGMYTGKGKASSLSLYLRFNTGSTPLSQIKRVSLEMIYDYIGVVEQFSGKHKQDLFMKTDYCL